MDAMPLSVMCEDLPPTAATVLPTACPLPMGAKARASPVQPEEDSLPTNVPGTARMVCGTHGPAFLAGWLSIR